ncbi:unnamed protein product, partial [Prorocentrum cordatum]
MLGAVRLAAPWLGQIGAAWLARPPACPSCPACPAVDARCEPRCGACPTCPACPACPGCPALTCGASPELSCPACPVAPHAAAEPEAAGSCPSPASAECRGFGAGFAFGLLAGALLAVVAAVALQALRRLAGYACAWLRQGRDLEIDDLGAEARAQRVVVALDPGTPGTAAIVTVDGEEYDEQVVGNADVLHWDLLPGGAPGGVFPWAPAARYYRFRTIPTVAALTAAAGRACARLGLAAPAGPVVPKVAGRAPAAAAPAAAPAGALALPAGGAPGPEGGGVAALVAAFGGPAGGAAGGALAPAPAPVAAAVAPAALVAGGAPAPPAGLGMLAPGPAGPAVAAAPGVAPPAAVPAPAGVPAGGAQASPGGDARIFAVVRGARGVRRADFRVMVAQMVEFPWPDWPVRGPRTLLWVLQHMAQRSGTPTAHHQRWLAETGLDPESPGVD